ncbi:MAG: hypothetical protein S4CHLAM123_10260 [Chlamydiales bacterium]|nr:hypothetical protein [Chlamydiales bacterium]
MKFLALTSLSLLISPIYGIPIANSPSTPADHEGGTLSQAYSAGNAQAIYFLSITDNQAYASSYGETGKLLQDLISKEQWIGAMKASRLDLGYVRARKVTAHQFTNELKGRMRGDFLILKYDTQFSQKASAIETVILMRQGRLGLWKVISYTIGLR